MKKLLIFLILIWGGGALAYYYYYEGGGGRASYRTVEVRRGDLRAAINATGTIEPEEVVDVGAQIAGEIQGFGTDPRDESKPISYGTPVEKGTVLARLDDALYRARLAQAQAAVARAEAEVAQAIVKVEQMDHELDRKKDLRKKNPQALSRQEYDEAAFNADTARAGQVVAKSAVEVARADFEVAKVNLGYTTIRSPIRGVVISRRVNVGQTVVSSLNAASLFLIAKDLGHMEIWAAVNETDIGAIHEGQAVRFTVGGIKEEFAGKVGQIRLDASMASGVVSYTVVVEFDNSAGKLKPYQTARLEFEVDTRERVLLVPNAALRWRPKPSQVALEFRDAFAHPPARKTPDAKAGDRPTEAAAGTLWVQAEEFVRPVEVRIGLNDGVRTEILGESVKEGDAVIVGQSVREADGAGGHPLVPDIRGATKAKQADRDKAKEPAKAAK